MSYFTNLEDANSLLAILKAVAVGWDKWEPSRYDIREHVVGCGLGVSIKRLRSCDFDAQVCKAAKGLGAVLCR